MKVTWDDYSQYMEKQKMFQTTNQISCTILICDICPTFPNKYTGYTVIHMYSACQIQVPLNRPCMPITPVDESLCFEAAYLVVQEECFATKLDGLS